MSVSTDKNFDEKLLKLQSWLNELYGDCEVIPHESSIASGFSNETFVFDVKGKNVLESLVLRLRPTGYQVFPDYDLNEDPGDPPYLHVQALSNATLKVGDKAYEGRGVLEQLILGAHEPSGFVDLFDKP